MRSRPRGIARDESWWRRGAVARKSASRLTTTVAASPQRFSPESSILSSQPNPRAKAQAWASPSATGSSASMGAGSKSTAIQTLEPASASGCLCRGRSEIWNRYGGSAHHIAPTRSKALRWLRSAALRQLTLRDCRRPIEAQHNNSSQFLDSIQSPLDRNELLIRRSSSKVTHREDQL